MTESTSAFGNDALDERVRRAAFDFLDRETSNRGSTLQRTLLVDGFQFQGQKVPLIGPQGIFKPAILQLPLSITTVPLVPGRSRPYDDEIRPDGLIRYRFRGTDPSHRDNAGLRVAMERRVPLVYLH